MKIRIPRKLKKKYKKMGIWGVYLTANIFDPILILHTRKAFEDFVLYGECRVDFSSTKPKALIIK